MKRAVRIDDEQALVEVGEDGDAEEAEIVGGFEGGRFSAGDRQREWIRGRLAPIDVRDSGDAEGESAAMSQHQAGDVAAGDVIVDPVANQR